MEENDQSFDQSARENIDPNVPLTWTIQSASEFLDGMSDKPIEQKTLELSAPMADEVLGRVKQTQSALYQLGKDFKANSDNLAKDLQVLRQGSGIAAARSSQSDALVREVCERMRLLYTKAHFMEIAHANQLSAAQELSNHLLNREKPLEIKLSLVARWGYNDLVAARFATRLIYSTSESLANYELHNVYATRTHRYSSVSKNEDAEGHWTSAKVAIKQAMAMWYSGRERSLEISSHKPYNTVCVELICPCINSLTPVAAIHSDPLDCKTRRLAQEVMIALHYHLQSTSFERLETMKIDFIPTGSTI